MISIGLIGAGRIGRVHAETIGSRIPEAELVAVADVRREWAQSLAQQWGAKNAYTDHRQILADPSIHAVLICSPTETHAPLIQEAARAGKHIFCEKPIDLNLERVQEVLQTMAETPILFQLGFNRRFDPHFRNLYDSLRAGKIGTPQILRITSRDPQPPSWEYIAASGGLFLDMMIHDFDMARFLLQDEVEDVYATGAALLNPEFASLGDIDTATVILTFKKGTLCTIDNSRKAVYGYDQRLEVLGPQGCMLVANPPTSCTTLWNEHGSQHAPPPYFFVERYQDAYMAELREFVDCILLQRQPSVGGSDGLASLRLALAAKKSLHEKRPVRLCEIS